MIIIARERLAKQIDICRVCVETLKKTTVPPDDLFCGVTGQIRKA